MPPLPVLFLGVVGLACWALIAVSPSPGVNRRAHRAADVASAAFGTLLLLIAAALYYGDVAPRAQFLRELREAGLLVADASRVELELEYDSRSAPAWLSYSTTRANIAEIEDAAREYLHSEPTELAEPALAIMRGSARVLGLPSHRLPDPSAVGVVSLHGPLSAIVREAVVLDPEQGRVWYFRTR